MFRELRRKKQQLSEAECAAVLKGELRGVLSVLGDDDYPYGVPIDFLYDEESGHLFFHGGRQGHKMDALRRHDKASFCCYDAGFRREGDWALNIKSVIVFGRIRPVEDSERALALCRALCHKFTQDEAYIDHAIEVSGRALQMLELVPEQICGKIVNES